MNKIDFTCEWKPSHKEMDTVSRLSEEETIEYVFSSIIDRDCIWVAYYDDDYHYSAYMGDNILFPIWPSVSYAKNAFTGSKFKPMFKCLTVSQFYDKIIKSETPQKLYVFILPDERGKGIPLSVVKFDYYLATARERRDPIHLINFLKNNDGK